MQTLLGFVGLAVGWAIVGVPLSWLAIASGRKEPDRVKVRAVPWALQPVRQREFARALGKVLHRPAVMPTPAFAVRLAVGELAEYALQGRKVLPRALLDLGFVFSRPNVEDALRS